jgi:hypothetical protein
VGRKPAPAPAAAAAAAVPEAADEMLDLIEDRYADE